MTAPPHGVTAVKHILRSRRERARTKRRSPGLPNRGSYPTQREKYYWTEDEKTAAGRHEETCEAVQAEMERAPRGVLLVVDVHHLGYGTKRVAEPAVVLDHQDRRGHRDDRDSNQARAPTGAPEQAAKQDSDHRRELRPRDARQREPEDRGLVNPQRAADRRPIPGAQSQTDSEQDRTTACRPRACDEICEGDGHRRQDRCSEDRDDGRCSRSAKIDEMQLPERPRD